MGSTYSAPLFSSPGSCRRIALVVAAASLAILAALSSRRGGAKHLTSLPRDRPCAEEPPLSLQAKISARQHDVETLEVLSERLRESLLGVDALGRTLIFYAARGIRDDNGKLTIPSGYFPASDAIAHLAEKHSLDVNFQARDTGMTPLMEAARHGNPHGVAALLELRAEPGLVDVNGRTALDIARTQLPQHLDVKAAQCSENFWDSFKRHVDADRELAARELRDAQSRAASR